MLLIPAIVLLVRTPREALVARLRKTVVGDPAAEGVRMGALASHAQQADVADKESRWLQLSELVESGG